MPGVTAPATTARKSAGAGAVAFKLPKGPTARAIGLDFGTTYSSVSVAIGDRVYLIPDEHGVVLQPSLVAYPEHGAPIVGEPARQMMAEDPRRVVASAKRFLGRQFSHPKIAGLIYSAAYKILPGPNDSILIDMDGETYAIGQVCAQIIGHMRQIATRQLGFPVTQAVLSCPVGFEERERTALKRAAEIAGLKVLALIEEPVAGALAYGLARDQKERVAVYDFGGGTFDFQRARARGGAVQGSGHRRGRLARGGRLRHRAGLRVGGPLLAADSDRAAPEDRRMAAAADRKRACQAGADRGGHGDPAHRGGGRDPGSDGPSPDLRPGHLEALCAELLDRSICICSEVLESLELTPQDMDQVVVMGGISRIPMVRGAVAKLFDRVISEVVNPEEAVVIGAGLHAAKLVGMRWWGLRCK